VPRDRDGTFEPQIVRKRQRRLTGVDQIVLSLYAKGLTTGKVIEEMAGWCARPLDASSPRSW
jgi:putative transposase